MGSGGDLWRDGSCRPFRRHWPRTQILIRADSHYGMPEVIDLCRANGIDFILGVATSKRLRKPIEGLEAQVAARFGATL